MPLMLGTVLFTRALDNPTPSASVLSRTPAGVSASRHRYALMDVLRYIAAMMVALMHWGVELGPQNYEPLYSIPVVGYLITHGSLGVPIFFVISGFVIVQSAARAPTSLSFIFARTNRLLPGLIVCMALVLVVGSRFVQEYQTPFSSFVNSVFLTYPVTQVQPLAPQLWSLVLEIKFYAAIAVLLAVYPAAFRHPFGIIAMVVTWQGIMFAAGRLLAPQDSLLLNRYVSLEYTSAFFCLGMCLSQLATIRHKIGVSAVALVLTTAYIGTKIFASEVDPWDGLIVGVSAILILLSTKITLNRQMQSAARALGLASYLIYLLHIHIGIAFLNVFRDRVSSNVPLAVVAVTIFITSLSIALALYIERPLQQWLQQVMKTLSTRPRVPLATA